MLYIVCKRDVAGQEMYWDGWQWSYERYGAKVLEEDEVENQLAKAENHLESGEETYVKETN